MTNPNTNSVAAFIAANRELAELITTEPGERIEALYVRSNTERARLILRHKINELLIATGQMDPPVNLYRVAARCGIRRILRASIPIDGQIIKDGENYDIELRASAPRRRQRFSLAHELSHTFFLEHVPELLRSRDQGAGGNSHWKAEEALCNFGAAEFLMPPGPFLRDALSTGPSLDALEWLSNRWDVSRETCVRRICELNAWNVTFAIFRKTDTGYAPSAVINRDGTGSYQTSLHRHGSTLAKLISRGSPWQGYLRICLGGAAERYYCAISSSEDGQFGYVMAILGLDAAELHRRSQVRVWQLRPPRG